VEVDDDDRRLSAGLLDELVDDLERRLGDLEEQPTHQVEDGHRRAVRSRRDGERAAGRMAREVRGTEHALRRIEIWQQLAARPGVVAERHDVRARREQPVGQLGRDAPPVGRVLAVHDAEVDGEVGTQPREPFLQGAAARRAEHVRDEEQLHGLATRRRVGGRTDP